MVSQYTAHVHSQNFVHVTKRGECVTANRDVRVAKSDSARPCVPRLRFAPRASRRSAPICRSTTRCLLSTLTDSRCGRSDADPRWTPSSIFSCLVEYGQVSSVSGDSFDETVP